jgi:hypothetical protein
MEVTISSSEETVEFDVLIHGADLLLVIRLLLLKLCQLGPRDYIVMALKPFYHSLVLLLLKPVLHLSASEKSACLQAWTIVFDAALFKP